VFTAWTAREHLTLPDELSKADWAKFEEGLQTDWKIESQNLK